MNERERTDAALGREVAVDFTAIEQSLAELWRGEHRPGGAAVTRAALWNVVAHTWSAAHHHQAGEILRRVAAAVPQRSIVIRAEPHEPKHIASWISANCQMVHGEKQVCSEEVAIVAAGEHVERVPPLVHALLIPDMPVAVWWLGDLPNGDRAYVERLLEPADRLIVDSAHFNSAADLGLIARMAEETASTPADLNWVRLEEWRAATATLFDPPEMREQLRTIRTVRIVAAGNGGGFGERTASLLYAAWLRVQSGADPIDFRFSNAAGGSGSLSEVEVTFDGGSTARVSCGAGRNVIVGEASTAGNPLQCVRRIAASGLDDLLIRQLKRAEGDRVFVRVLPEAIRLAGLVA